MGFMAMAMLAFVSTICLMSTAESAPCPLNTAEISIRSTADVQNLTDLLDCVGQGIFNVTWRANLTIDERIDVSDGKHVTVTGNALNDDNAAGVIIGAGSGTGIFSVSDKSTLRLNNIGFEGGNAKDGGAVAVLSSSTLYVFGCTFTYNNASNGGALFASDSSIYVNGSTSFEANTALYGGAVYVDGSGIFIDGDTSFGHNSAEGSSEEIVSYFTSSTDSGGVRTAARLIPPAPSGGAIYANASVVNIDGDISFAANLAYFQGGAIGIGSSSLRIYGNATFTRNSAGSAGAVFASDSELFIDGTAVFTHNSAALDGGAVHASDSELSIDGNAMFTHNSAGEMGGAISVFESSFTIGSSKINRGGLSGNEGGLYSDAGGDYTSNWSVVFLNNSAGEWGGAISSEACDQVEVCDSIFKSNKASIGGAVYIVAVDDKQTWFSECVFEGNTAEDGGALYLNTALGVDIFSASVFRNNFAWISGGAIFHTGSMRVLNTSFVANKAMVEAPAVMSVGYVDVMYNVTFSENAYHCPVGEYGYIEKNESHFCRSCVEEVCSRCLVADYSGRNISLDIRIDGKPVCAVPPVGATAPFPGTTIANLALQEGYFRTSNETHDIRQCYQKGACAGGNDAEHYCKSGYTGPYCAVCEQDFASGITSSCHECSGYITRSAVGLAVALGLAVLLLAGSLFSYLGKVEHDGAGEGIQIDQRLWGRQICSCRAFIAIVLPVRAIKITVTVWQIISQSDAIAGDVYPELYQTLVFKLNLINLNLDLFSSYSCLVRNDFYDHLVLATITPLLALVILAGSLFVRNKMNRCSESAMREVRHKHQAVVLFMAFLVYSPVSYRIFQTFGCDELDNGETYLRADYSLSCSTHRHSWYRVYAFVMVAVYPVGIPAAFAGLLMWHRRDLVKPDRGTMLHLEPLNGLWAAYKPSRYYYEVVECGRRIIFTVIAVCIAPDPAVQLSTHLLFAAVYAFISEVLSPFQKGIDTVLYRWGNGTIVASMYVAFLTKVGFEEDTASAGYLLTFSGVIIAAKLFMVVTVFIQMVFLTKEICAMKNSVRVSDIPVRRTHSVSSRNQSPVPEGEVCRDGSETLESKDCEI